MNLPSDILALMERLAGELPGETAHKEMLPYREVTSTMLKSVEDYRESAVAILLYHENETLKSVLIQRPTYNGTHSGQMAFPGGKKDPEDADLIATALREMHEEIGFHDEYIMHLGQLSRVYIPVSRFLVYPHLFYSRDVYPFTPDPIEVEDIITFPLYDITLSENKTTTKIKLDNNVVMKDIPCFMINGKVVWGATALMMEELRRVFDQ
jgi:8-oxo-dGTP pyrophosphatase MutT (NUDIX family)